MLQRPRWIVAIALSAALAAIASARAEMPLLKPVGPPWPVHGDIPANKDISGIACVTIAPNVRRCILAVDEGFSAALVTLENNSVTADGTIQLLPEMTKELDAEAAAYDPQTSAFYVIGSHGASRRKCDPNPASYHLVRIPIDPLTGRPVAGNSITIAKSIRLAMFAAPRIGPYVDKCLGSKDSPGGKVAFEHQSGANIEGLAILGNRLFAGFRGPVDGRTAFMLAFDRDALFVQDNAPAVTIPVELAEEGQGIRDLAAVAGGLLILSGPQDDIPGNAALYFFDTSTGKAAPLGRIPDPTNQGKPEALLLLGETETTYRVLIMSDGIKNGEPTEFLVDKTK